MGRLDEFLACRSHLQQTVVLHLLLQVTSYQGLANHGIPDLLILVGTCPEALQFIMMVSQDLVRLLTDDEVDHIVGTEILLDGQNGCQSRYQLILGLYLSLRMQTVVAVAAVILRIDFSEVMEKHLTATDGGFRIGSSLYEQLSANILLGHRLTLHKLIQFLKILIRIEGDTETLAAVTPGSSRLLVIAFQRLRDVVVYHEAHIGLIDTHTEGDGGHDDVDVFHQEGILRLCTGGRVESCMVGRSLDVVGSQDGCQLLHLLARQAIDDAALTGMLLDKLDDVLIHILGLRPHLVIKVRTIKRTLELRSIEDTQVLLDVAAHLVRCRRRQRNNGCLAYLVDNRTDTAVFRAEVMAPFRNTMRLIDGIERDLHRLQELHIVLLRQRLGGDIQQFGVSCQDVCLHLIYRGFVQR